MKKYKLLKDLPNCGAGTIFKELAEVDKPAHARNDIFYAPSGHICPSFSEYQMQSNTDWFELVNEWPKSYNELKDIVGYQGSSISLFANKQQAKSSDAFAQLSQLAKAINGDWVANWENENQAKFVVGRMSNVLYIECWRETFYLISFHSREAAEFSLEHHRDLWEQYYMM